MLEQNWTINLEMARGNISENCACAGAIADKPRFLLVLWQNVIHDWSPLLAHPNERRLMFRPCDSHLSTSKSMIPYHRKHGSKWHIHGKSSSFGYKMWHLATHSGYVIQGETYQGASTIYSISELGMGSSVVMNLISEVWS